MSNLFAQFKRLLPAEPLQIGTVIAVDGDVATVELPGGGRVQARGAATVAQTVFVRAGAIEGEAPTLPVELVDL
jgi:hypothetical protein